MGRNPIVALILFIIPVVDLYLIYKWWDELKAAKKSDASPILWTILMLVPLVNLYAIYKLMGTVDAAAKKAGKDSYALGVPVLFILSLLIGIPILYVAYKTQVIMNDCGI